jgi:CTP:molybdopterin cytidylyltransferase MocA
VAAVVLAAGGSKRLGEPKQLVPYQGKPLIRHVAEEVSASSCRWLGVVLGGHEAQIAPALVGVRGTLLSHDTWRDGLASSLRRAVHWAASLPCDGLLVVLGDQLRVSTPYLESLLELFEAGSCLVASHFDDAIGAPAVFPRASFDGLASLTGDRGARDIIRATRPRIEVAWDGAREDLDTPADKARVVATAAGVTGARSAAELLRHRQATVRNSGPRGIPG